MATSLHLVLASGLAPVLALLLGAALPLVLSWVAIWVLEETDQPEPGTPEVQMHDFLDRILKGKDQSEHSGPGSARGANAWFYS